MSADPRPNTARLPDGRLDPDLEYRFRVIFADLRTVLGEASAAGTVLARLDRLEAETTQALSEVTQALTTQAQTLAALSASVDTLEQRAAGPAQ